MGYGSYSVDTRVFRAKASGYYDRPVNEIFTQNKIRQIHAEMDPARISIREARDSQEHPNTVPVQLYLDVTGSMGRIPHEMIKDGLPTLVGTLIQNGVKDVALMFGAIGDHECDQAPLQIGQFESGDAELDLWLERTWIEGNGGGNAGESYLLAWYFAGNHVVTDAFEKRNQKGFVFTVGDEPCLKNLPMSAVKEIMRNNAVGQANFTREELLEKAQSMNHVYHIHISHGERHLDPAWTQMLGKNVIVLDDYRLLSRTISDIILLHKPSPIKDHSTEEIEKEPKKELEML